MSQSHTQLDDLSAWNQVNVRALHAHEDTNEGGPDIVRLVEPKGNGSPELLNELLSQGKDKLEALIGEHGAVIFRGFKIDPPRFRQAVLSAYNASRYIWMMPMPPKLARFFLSLPIVGPFLNWFLGVIEAWATGRTLTQKDASTLAYEDNIQFPHHEFGIFFNIPRVIAFLCQKQSDTGGETLFCDAELAWKNVRPELRAHFETAKFIRYKNENQFLPPPFTAPALLKHPKSGVPSLNLTGYHHQLVAEEGQKLFPEARIELGDHDENFMFKPTLVDANGKPVELSENDYREIISAHLAQGILLPWKEGDVLFCDNYKVVHGRVNGGYPRKVLQVMLCDYQKNQTRFFA